MKRRSFLLGLAGAPLAPLALAAPVAVTVGMDLAARDGSIGMASTYGPPIARAFGSGRMVVHINGVYDVDSFRRMEAKL